MENSPLNITNPDTGSEKKESKSKKKKAGELGAFAVEPKRSKEKPAKPVFESAVESESSAPLEHLAEPEKQFAEREFTKAEQAADLEPVEAVERFRNRIIIEGQDSDTALNETLAELQDLPDVETAPAELVEAVIDETEAETSPDVDDRPHEFGEEVILLNEQTASIPEDDPLDEEATTDASATSRPAVATPAGGGGTGSPPPRSPNGPFGSSGAAPFGGSGAPAGGSGFNAAPVAPIHTVEYRRGNTVAPALVGGVVGYLVGRRRGRIKTEKRLIPVQKKLQKEVVALQSRLQQKEAQIRTVAATKDQEKLKPIAAESIQAPERPVVIVRAPAAEANQLHGKRHAPEQIGHVLVGAESFARVFKGSEYIQNVKILEQEQPSKPVKIEKIEKQSEQLLSVEKNIDTLNRVDLLKLSERIIIDGASLRQIYETRLVGEKGLRRLVKEHLKGGDVKKALRREIVEREIDFERDPGLRDQPLQTAAAPKGGGRAATLNDLLQNAELAVGEDQEEVAFLKARSAYEEFEREQQTSKQKMMDISFITIIACLLGLVVFLVISHR